MPILLLFAFAAGIVTILSPCILPVLPIILSGSLGKQRPLSIIAGFILSFTFFTLFLSIIVKATGIPADTLRFLAITVIALFGVIMVAGVEVFKLAFIPKTSNGLLLGMSLGLVWAPCVGPILASIIALALTGTVTTQTFFITLAYAVGTAIPMLIVLSGGKRFIPTTPAIQKIFGALMIVVALSMFFNLDRKFQTWILSAFPNYGVGLTKFEDNPFVKKQLEALRKEPMDESKRGKPMYEVLEPDLGNAPELTGGQQWFNSEPLTLTQLRGNVVLVDFWTYTCINCIRTLPYLRSWWEKYSDKGLVIIGVHTPEFEFEKNPENVAKAIKDFALKYPIVQDNDYAIWNAYNNHYWPAKYLIDKNGKIQYTHFGEGDYDETEKKIQELLAIDMPIDNPDYQVRSRTPETYLGTARTEAWRYTLTGTWTKSEEYAMPTKGATLQYEFDAMNVFLVMRPKNGSGKVEVHLDGELVTTITVDSDRLYDLIKLPEPGKHMLELKFLDSNLELYAFTFG